MEKIKKILFGVAIVWAAYHFLAFVGVFVIFFGAIILDEIDIQHNVPNFYREAGFSGGIVDVEREQQGISTLYYYTYREETDKQGIRVRFFNSGEDLSGKELKTIDGLVENYTHNKVAPLFDEGMMHSASFQKISILIQESVELAGGELTGAVLDREYEMDNEEFIQEELKKDLYRAERHQDTFLRGLTSLNAKKYIGLGLYEVEVILPDTSAHIDLSALDVSAFPDGSYEFIWKTDDSMVIRTSYVEIKDQQLLPRDQLE